MKTIMLALLLAAGPGGYDLFQKALVKERGEGNIEEAIRLYQRIVREHAADRPLAAKALVQIGQCYEKLGKEEARKAYERVVREYADQSGPAADARARLAALAPARSTRESRMLSRRLWTGKSDDITRGASTNGRLVVFTDWSTGDLAALDLATGKQRRLTNKGDWSQNPDFAQFPMISPDGKLVAFSWWSGKERFYQLRVMGTTEGSVPQAVYSNQEVPIIFASGWSGDGKQLLVKCDTRVGASQIGLLAATGGELRVLKSFGGRGLPGMSLSPDGRYVAYDFPQSEEGPERDIFLLASDGSREVALVRHPGHDVKPTWTPDGSRVLFFSDRGGATGLWSVPVSEGQVQGAPQLIQANIGQGFPLGFSGEGGFHYGAPSGANDLVVAEMDVEAGKFLSEPAAVVSRYGRPIYQPQWSPDGRSLAYAVRTPSMLARGGPLQVVVRDMASGREREMNQGFRTLGGPPRWRPDGRTLLVYGLPADGPAKTFQLDVADGSAAPLPGVQDWTLGCPYAQWSSTSEAVLCFRRESMSEPAKIVRRRLDTGEERVLLEARIPSPNVRLSPDGRWLAFLSEDMKGLKLVSGQGGEVREVFRVESKQGSLRPLSWTPDSRHLLCRDADGSVWRISMPDGAASKLPLPVKGVREVQVHPDGKRVAMWVQDPGAEIWVLENFLPTLRAAK